MQPELVLLEGFLDDIKKGFSSLTAKGKTLGKKWMLLSPREVIELALDKYENDYTKAYKWLKAVREGEIDKEEDKKEYSNLTQAIKAFRSAITKASGKDPEGGLTAEDEAAAQKEQAKTPESFAGSYKEIAQDYLDEYKTPSKAAKVLSATAERLKDELGAAESEQIKKAVSELVGLAQRRYDKTFAPEQEAQTRAERETLARKKFYAGTEDDIYRRILIASENDPKKAASKLSQLYGQDVHAGILTPEDEQKVANVLKKLQGDTPKVETSAGTQAAAPQSDFGALISKDKTYGDRANLRDVLVRKINALPENRKADLMKAMQDKPDAALRIAQAYLKGG